ncbi:MAG: hypothetical protein VXY93_22450, partial [Pseudomonadota bacterium]|nr:hypothetical protein [Pseudomonadota bacterium]
AIWNTGGEIFNLAQYADSTPDLVFKIKNSGESAPVEKVRFASDGKVGIGTDDPDSLLHLYSHNPFIKLETPVGDQWSQLAQIGSNLKIRLRNGSNNGTFAIQGYGGGTSTNFVNVDSDGKVGIGTNNPSVKLHVTEDEAGTTHLPTFNAATRFVVSDTINPSSFNAIAI